jgi:hypothetical protein
MFMLWLLAAAGRAIATLVAGPGVVVLGDQGLAPDGRWARVVGAVLTVAVLTFAFMAVFRP